MVNLIGDCTLVLCVSIVICMVRDNLKVCVMGWFLSEVQNLAWYEIGFKKFKSETIFLTYDRGCSEECRLSTMREF